MMILVADVSKTVLTERIVGLIIPWSTNGLVVSHPQLKHMMKPIIFMTYKRRGVSRLGCARIACSKGMSRSAVVKER